MSMTHKMVHRLEETEALDKPAKPLSAVVGRMVRPRIIRNLLSGTNLGHPLHPALTDVTIGAWSMATLLDWAGGPASEPAADLLVATGAISAVPTSLTGANDWADTLGEERRLGLVHAVTNSAALSLYTASLIMRRRGDRRKGKMLGLAGFGLMSLSGYIGGHLSFARGVNVNRTAWQQGPAEWTPVLTEAELADGADRTVEVGGVPILLYRSSGTVYAMAATCSHLGGPLGEGKIENDCVTCPWHGSTFRFADGVVHRGPASAPQPLYETRLQNGRIEVRVPPGPRVEERARVARRPLARTTGA